jgi:hypothetical protein
LKRGVYYVAGACTQPSRDKRVRQRGIRFNAMPFCPTFGKMATTQEGKGRDQYLLVYQARARGARGLPFWKTTGGSRDLIDSLLSHITNHVDQQVIVKNPIVFFLRSSLLRMQRYDHNSRTRQRKAACHLLACQVCLTISAPFQRVPLNPTSDIRSRAHRPLGNPIPGSLATGLFSMHQHILPRDCHVVRISDPSCL